MELVQKYHTSSTLTVLYCTLFQCTVYSVNSLAPSLCDWLLGCEGFLFCPSWNIFDSVLYSFCVALIVFVLQIHYIFKLVMLCVLCLDWHGPSVVNISRGLQHFSVSVVKGSCLFRFCSSSASSLFLCRTLSKLLLYQLRNMSTVAMWTVATCVMETNNDVIFNPVALVRVAFDAWTEKSSNAAERLRSAWNIVKANSNKASSTTSWLKCSCFC